MAINDLILYFCFFGAIAVSLVAFKHPEIGNPLNIAILAFTGVALVWTTVETKKNISESQISDLRPVILRSGWLIYSEVQFAENVNEKRVLKLIEFTNHKNISKDISGYMVIDKRKYTLVFGNENTQKIIPEEQTASIGLMKQWGWLPPGGRIFALPMKNGFTETDEANAIYITYQDIEGNSYFTKEDENYSQSSGKNLNKN